MLQAIEAFSMFHIRCLRGYRNNSNTMARFYTFCGIEKERSREMSGKSEKRFFRKIFFFNEFLQIQKAFSSSLTCTLYPMVRSNLSNSTVLYPNTVHIRLTFHSATAHRHLDLVQLPRIYRFFC